MVSIVLYGVMESRHILIVDDEPKVAFFLRQALERLNRNYRVTIAHSGEEALEVLGRSSLDLLVTDLRMPGISGLELIRRVRESSPQTRVILITAYGSEEVKVEAYRLDAHGYITKPFDIEQFAEVVQEALTPSEAEQAVTNEQRLRDQLVSLVFHNLRLPLTFVIGYASILVGQTVGNDREMAQAVLQHATRMREALDDFTLLAEWSVGQLPGYLQLVDLRRALETVAAQLSALALERHQVIEIVPAPRPVEVRADTWLLGILLTALVSTAIKRASTWGQIVLEAVEGDGEVVVTVRNEGGDPYGEEGAVDRRGVGMAVICSLAEAMGGGLYVGGEDDDVLFRLTLPADASAPQAG